MNQPDAPGTRPRNASDARTRWILRIVLGWALVVLLVLLSPQSRDDVATAFDRTGTLGHANDTATLQRAVRRAPAFPKPARTPQEIVARKVLQFGRSRREIVRAIGRRDHKDIPPEVERFFDALEAGNWAEIDAQWHVLAKRSGQYDNPGPPFPELNPFWSAVLDAYGVAEQAHDWPAQKLLNYGNAILDSLRPGMVYIGGTDPGRWIPELLNETSGSEPHIIVTQNAFADSRYMDYMNTLYGDRMATLTGDDSQKAFADYTGDARKRLEHDQQFPDEPKQVRPGENIRVVDGKVEVSGQEAVMAINEKLFQMMLDKNPDMSFAIEQSYPFKSTYENATPAGPIMEVRVQDGQNALTQERAAQSVDYWRNTAQQLLADPETPVGSDPRKAYSKLAADQADLLLARNYPAEAEQELRLAHQLSPESPEPVYRYVNLLVGQSRGEEAISVVEKAIQADSRNQKFRDLLADLQKKIQH